MGSGLVFVTESRYLRLYKMRNWNGTPVPISNQRIFGSDHLYPAVVSATVFIGTFVG